MPSPGGVLDVDSPVKEAGVSCTSATVPASWIPRLTRHVTMPPQQVRELADGREVRGGRRILAVAVGRGR